MQTVEMFSSVKTSRDGLKPFKLEIKLYSRKFSGVKNVQGCFNLF